MHAYMRLFPLYFPILVLRFERYWYAVFSSPTSSISSTYGRRAHANGKTQHNSNRGLRGRCQCIGIHCTSRFSNYGLAPLSLNSDSILPGYTHDRVEGARDRGHSLGKHHGMPTFIITCTDIVPLALFRGN
eukprot:6392521-Amphidinium_carterae.1